MKVMRHNLYRQHTADFMPTAADFFFKTRKNIESLEAFDKNQ